jgi:outer membrane protein
VVKFCRMMLLPFLLLSAGSAFAEMKIAVVNVQRAIGETEEAKTFMANLEAQYKGEQDAIRTLNSEITQQQEKFVKDGEVMSEAEKRKLQKEIEDKQMDYQFRVNKLQKAVNEKQQELLGQMAPKLDAVLKDINTRDQYDLVMHRQNVLFVNPTYDITAQVTEALNQKK